MERTIEVRDYFKIISWLRDQQGDRFKKVEGVWRIKSKKGRFLFLWAFIPRSFGLIKRHAYFIIRRKPEPKIIGEVTIVREM